MKKTITATIVLSIFAQMLVVGYAYDTISKKTTTLACSKCKAKGKSHKKVR